MKFRSILFVFFLIFYVVKGFTQPYTSYLTGDSADVVAMPAGGVCMMGGATENDQASRWFLNRCAGGDILVLRTTGTDGYNSYFYSLPGTSVNSVETIVCNSATASYDPYVLSRIRNAEGIWFAGGDQWQYISYWRNTPLDSTVRAVVANRQTVIGGTSAGMAILGEYYYTAQNSSILSAEALNNPYSVNATLSNALFISHPLLEGVITDTHFDNPDRRGRLMAFLARILKDDGRVVTGIACEEYSAACVDTDGKITLYGEYPQYDDHVWFARAACGIADSVPESCTEGNPLRWYRGGHAVDVYKGNADSSGNSYFLQSTYESFGSFEALSWISEQGILTEVPASGIPCAPMWIESEAVEDMRLLLYPQPSGDFLNVTCGEKILHYTLTDMSGRILMQGKTNGVQSLTLQTVGIPSGMYVFSAGTIGSVKSRLCVIQQSEQ